MILHIPHSSTNTLGKNFLCDIDKELSIMTDLDTDKLFNHPKATKIVFEVSRLVCDVERFEDDSMEEMSAFGMGVCYTHNSQRQPLRHVSTEEREEIINKYYRPHHRRLTKSAEKELKENNSSIIIDCHSFPNDPLPCNINKETPRPEICIGTDEFHTPDWLISLTKDFFVNLGYTIAINNPFSGTMIPMKYYKKNKNVIGIMLEINRDIYREDLSKTSIEIRQWLDKVYFHFTNRSVDAV